MRGLNDNEAARQIVAVSLGLLDRAQRFRPGRGRPRPALITIERDRDRKAERSDASRSSKSEKAARLPALRAKANIVENGEDCTSMGKPPRAFKYTGGTYDEYLEVAQSPGCIREHPEYRGLLAGDGELLLLPVTREREDRRHRLTNVRVRLKLGKSAAAVFPVWLSTRDALAPWGFRART